MYFIYGVEAERRTKLTVINQFFLIIILFVSVILSWMVFYRRYLWELDQTVTLQFNELFCWLLELLMVDYLSYSAGDTPPAKESGGQRRRWRSPPTLRGCSICGRIRREVSSRRHSEIIPSLSPNRFFPIGVSSMTSPFFFFNWCRNFVFWSEYGFVRFCYGC